MFSNKSGMFKGIRKLDQRLDFLSLESLGLTGACLGSLGIAGDRWVSLGLTMAYQSKNVKLFLHHEGVCEIW